MHLPADGDLLVFRLPLGTTDAYTFAVVGEPAREPSASLVRTFKRAHAVAAWRGLDVWFRHDDGSFELMKRFRNEVASPSSCKAQRSFA